RLGALLEPRDEFVTALDGLRVGLISRHEDSAGVLGARTYTASRATQMREMPDPPRGRHLDLCTPLIP
ncbi:MAG TPA: hypothetical protein VIQ29_15130, partial [Ancylobacter sp.]